VLALHTCSVKLHATAQRFVTPCTNSVVVTVGTCKYTYIHVHLCALHGQLLVFTEVCFGITYVQCTYRSCTSTPLSPHTLHIVHFYICNLPLHPQTALLRIHDTSPKITNPLYVCTGSMTDADPQSAGEGPLQLTSLFLRRARKDFRLPFFPTMDVNHL